MTDSKDPKNSKDDFKQSASEKEWRKLGYEQAEAEKEAARAATASSQNAGYGGGGNNGAGFTVQNSPAGFGAGGAADKTRFSLKEEWLMNPMQPEAFARINQVIDRDVITKILENGWQEVAVDSGYWGWGGKNPVISRMVKNRIEDIMESDAALSQFGHPAKVRSALSGVKIK